MSYRDEDWALGLQVARERESAHPDAGHHAIPQDPLLPQRLGCLIEVIFSREFGVPIDRSLRPLGDDGIDFWLPLGVRTSCQSIVTVDTKAMRHQGPDLCLLVKEGTVDAELYVMGSVIRQPHGCPWIGVLRGWALAEEVLSYPPRVFSSEFKYPSHGVPVADLRPIWRLHSLHQWGYEEEDSHAPKERVLTQSRERKHSPRKESRKTTKTSGRHRT